MSTRKGRFVISKRKGLFCWKLKSSNGTDIAQSIRGYEKLQRCLDNITSVVGTVSDAKVEKT